MEGYRSFEIEEECPFNLDNTLLSGQAPRWKKIDNWWYGIARDSVIKTMQADNTLYFSGCSERYYREYFSLGYDLNNFYDSFRDDKLIQTAIHKEHGMRIVRQDPWECLCFQMAVTKNRNVHEIDRFTRISQKFGEEIELDGNVFYTFPTAETIIEVGLPKLKSCNLGYKADNLYSAATRVAADPFWIKKIKSADTKSAIRFLTDFKGIREIVAEWILVFAFGRYELFPLDSHIRNLMKSKYFLETHLPRNPKSIDRFITGYAEDNFGMHSAYILEYLFAARDLL